MPSRPISTGRLHSNGARAEVLVHLVKSFEHGSGNSQVRQPPWSKVRSPNPSNSARPPSPRTRTCLPCRFRTSPLHCVGRHRDEVFGNGFFVASQPRQRPVPCRMGVGHGFERGKCLGRDDEERLRRIKVLHGLVKIGSIHIRHKAESQTAVTIMPQRFVGHHRDQGRNRQSRC